MTIQTVRTPAHVAHLNPMLGIGTLMLPSPTDDVRLASITTPVESGPATLAVIRRASLHEADWNSIMQRICADGWEPLEDDQEGGFVHLGFTAEMLEVIALTHVDPIVSDPSADLLQQGWAELHDEAGLVFAP